jgi:hypothetical protein
MMKDSTLLGGRKDLPLEHRGAVTSGCLVFLILILLLGYVGFKFGEAFWEYLEVRQKTREALNWAAAGQAKSEIDIVQKVITKVREVGVELAPRSIQIKQTTDTLTILVAWSREVEFPYYTLPLKFRVTQTEEKRWHRGGLIIK